MPGPLDALRHYFSAAGAGTTESPYAPWQQTAQRIGEGTIDAITGLLVVGSGKTRANQIVQVVGAAAPVLSGLKRFQFWHDIPDLERLAGGSGPFRTYHGTTEDIGQKILSEGVRLPSSGEAASRDVAAQYGIPFTQWQRDIPWSGYGDETRRLSTAPYPIAARWAQHFPQGEIKSGLNAQARVLAYARQRGIPYDQAYEDVYDTAAKRGIRNLYEGPTAAGLPDLLAPQSPYGVVLGIDTDVRALRPRNSRDAEYLLEAIQKGKMSPIDALREWNLQYQDMKVAPQNIQNIEAVSRFLRK